MYLRAWRLRTEVTSSRLVIATFENRSFFHDRLILENHVTTTASVPLGLFNLMNYNLLFTPAIQV